jgi:hypothetical protein
VETLRERWQRDMPDILFTDDRVNDLLVALETAMMKLPGWTPQTLAWNAKEKDQALPLPILGLEYTLNLYDLDRSIRFPAVTVLDLRGWSLTGARSSILYVRLTRDSFTAVDINISESSSPPSAKQSNSVSPVMDTLPRMPRSYLRQHHVLSQLGSRSSSRRIGPVAS